MIKTNKKRKRVKLLLIIALAGIAIFAGLYMENASIDVETIPVSIQGLPESFDGLRILQLSDLHYPCCALSPEELTALVEKNKPDLIVLTGDSFDRYIKFDAGDLSLLARKLSAIAPCYAVEGNHEQLSGKQDQWIQLMRENGITVLDNEWTSVWREGKSVALCGLSEEGKLIAPPAPQVAMPVKIVLSHYPQYINQYAEAGYSLVFAGHAHGGQVRIFGQGLFAPGQGVFPKYTSGLYRQENTQMIVSRGLKEAYFPMRIGNTPHIPIAVLKPASGNCK